MSNSIIPFGLEPCSLDGSVRWTGGVNRYYLPSSDGTAMFRGDPVQLAGSADSYGGAPTVVKSTAGTNAYSVGAITAFENDPFDFSLYRAASAGRYCLVADDPAQLFKVRCDAQVALAATDIGNTANLIHGSGNTFSGTSATLLDTSNIGTGNQVTIVRLFQAPDNAFGTYAIAIVRFNLHQKLHTTGV